MVHVARFLLLLLAANVAQGILLGDQCSNHTACNYDDSSPVIGSKCTSTDPGSPGTCICGLGFYGEMGWDQCFQGELHKDCSSMPDGNAYCQTGDPNSFCDEGRCECQSGYYVEQTWAGRIVCLPVEVGAPCDSQQVSTSDQLCQIRMTGGVCQSASETCECPPDKVFVSSTSTCQKFLHSAACQACRSSGGLCWALGTNDTPEGCECPLNKEASGDPLTTGCDIGLADIGDFCELSGNVECSPDHSVCRHGTDISGRYTCLCEAGYTPVRNGLDDFGETMCYKTLSASTDPTCTNCQRNEGQCYDVDEDGVHDGCVCPLARSSSRPHDYRTHCDTTDFEVACSANTMTLTYDPHNSTQYGSDMSDRIMNGDSAIYIQGHLGTDPCVFEYDYGRWGLTLSLVDDFKVCGLVTRFPDPNKISYQNWVTLKIATNQGHQFVKFHAYCDYDVIARTMTEGVDIMGAAATASEGMRLSPTLTLNVYDQFARDASQFGMRSGQPAQLVIRMTDDVAVYTALRPDVCLVSSNPELNNPRTRTRLMLYEGCPVEDGPISAWNTFHHLPDNKKISQTGLFPIMQFDKSDSVFFQCAVRVCRDSSNCEEPTCEERKKRAVDMSRGGVEEYSPGEGGWQSVRSAPIRFVLEETNNVFTDGDRESLEEQVCIAGRCLTKGTALGIIIGVAVFCIFALCAISVTIYHIVIRRRKDATPSSSGDSVNQSGYGACSTTASNLYRPDINGERDIDESVLRRLPSEFFWQETGSDVVPDYDETESFYHPSHFRHHMRDPYYDDSYGAL